MTVGNGSGKLLTGILSEMIFFSSFHTTQKWYRYRPPCKYRELLTLISAMMEWTVSIISQPDDSKSKNMDNNSQPSTQNKWLINGWSL